LPQLDPVLDALVDILHRIWGKWDDVAANLIINGTLDYVTASCIEASLENSPSFMPTSLRFPWFFREASGIAKPYAAFGFSKSERLAGEDYFQVLPDMEYWIDLTNDLFS
jgi:hypothetical protein